jgi:hypothetical protein
MVKCGDRYCRHLVEIGVLDSLSCIMADGTCELKVAACQCFCEFLLVDDLCELIVLESDFLTALTDIIAGMNELTFELTLPKLQTLESAPITMRLMKICKLCQLRKFCQSGQFPRGIGFDCNEASLHYSNGRE